LTDHQKAIYEREQVESASFRENDERKTRKGQRKSGRKGSPGSASIWVERSVRREGYQAKHSVSDVLTASPLEKNEAKHTSSLSSSCALSTPLSSIPNRANHRLTFANGPVDATISWSWSGSCAGAVWIEGAFSRSSSDELVLLGGAIVACLVVRGSSG
jgi:hypothetical protein